MNPAWFVLIGGVALLVMMGIVVSRNRRRQQTERFLRQRLDGLRPAVDADAVYDSGIPRRSSFSGSMPRFLQVRFARLDIEPSWPQALMPFAVVGVVSVLLGRLFGTWVGGVALVVLLLVGAFVFEAMSRRRVDAFVRDLPGLFDVIKHLMLAGNSMQQALVRGIEASGETIQRHLLPLARRVQNGGPAAESVLWIAERLDVPELYIFGSAVDTNAKFGGRMSTTLGNLAQIVRDGERVRRELRSASAETRMSAIVLGCLPIGVTLIMTVLNPDYMRFFVETTTGQHMAMVAIGMQLSGILVMRRIMRLDF